MLTISITNLNTELCTTKNIFFISYKMFRNALSLFRTDFLGFFCNEIYLYSGGSGGLGGAGGAGGPGGPVPPSRGRGRGGPMTREELQKLREDELASQHNGKGRANTRLFNLFIIETKEFSSNFRIHYFLLPHNVHL